MNPLDASLSGALNIFCKFVPYKPDEVLLAESKSGLLIQGKLCVNKRNPYEATVRDTVNNQDIFIPSKEMMNRALDGDIVFVEILPRSLWTSPSRSLLHYKSSDDENIERDPSASSKNAGPPLPTGRVVGMLETARLRRAFVATLTPEDAVSSNSHVLVVPMDFRIPKIRIPMRRPAEFADQRLVIRIDRWPISSRYPEGHLVRALGPIGEVPVEIDSILIEHEIEVPPFSPEMLAELPPHNGRDWKPAPEEIRRRLDLRASHLIFSIDPPGCTDIDDALSIRLLEDGQLIEVGVHIADVTAFIPHNSLLDIEARDRGTTVYLANRRFDMLPEVLSANLCSIRANQDRYAMSVLWKFRKSNMQLVNTWFGRTLIRSQY